MKICWDNLNKIRYVPSTGNFKSINGRSVYHYHDSCMTCCNPFIGKKNNQWCSKSCARTSENNGMFGKTLSDSRKSKMLRGIEHPMYGRHHTIESKQKMSCSQNKGPKHRLYGRNIIPEWAREKTILSISGENHHLYDGGYRSNNIPKYDLYAHQIMPYEQCKRNTEDSNILEVKCTYCGKWYVPTIINVRNRIQWGINSNDTHRFYCSSSCKQECPLFGKKKYYRGHEGFSSREAQPELRKLVFLRDNFACEKCGSQKSLHCHHIDPVLCNPIESADVDNCITLCYTCHKWTHMNIEKCGYGYLANQSLI